MACIEVGGSGVETVRFAGETAPAITPGVDVTGSDLVAIAVPGIVRDGRVVAASNLDWWDVDPAEQLGLPVAAAVVLNDGEAAALGESVLRGLTDLVFVGLGTGVGGAVIVGGRVVADNLFGHLGGYSDRACPCGRTGCLETVAAGWALPHPIDATTIAAVGRAVADAITRDAGAARDGAPELVVVGGGIARRYPHLVTAVAAALEPSGRRVEASAAPASTKSAAAWGLRHATLTALGGAS